MPNELAPEMSSRRTKQAGKTDAANRYIPVHPQLIDLGFLDFIETCNGSDYLFNLEEQQGARGHYAGKRINDVLIRPYNFPGKKVFHSLRHSFRDFLSVVKVPAENIKALMGHSMSGDVTQASYGTPLRKNLAATADDYLRLDFSSVVSKVVRWNDIKHKFEQP